MKKLQKWSNDNQGLIGVLALIVAVISILPKNIDLPSILEKPYLWIKETLAYPVSIGTLLILFITFFLYRLLQAFMNRDHVIVISARYYTKSHSEDVTAEIKRRIEDQKDRNFRVGNSVLAYTGKSDIDPGVRKKLDIVYYIGSSLRKRTFTEDEHIKL